MSVKKNIFGDKQKMTVGGKGEVATSKYRVTKISLAVYDLKLSFQIVFPILDNVFKRNHKCNWFKGLFDLGHCTLDF